MLCYTGKAKFDRSGVFLMIGVILFLAVFGAIFAVIAFGIGLFFSNIILFDSLLLAIITGYWVHSQLAWHPVFCILLGFGVLVLLFIIQNTRIGFWTIGVFFSIAWSLIIGVFVLDGTGNDRIWCYFSIAVSFIVMIGLHLKARNRTSTKIAVED